MTPEMPEAVRLRLAEPPPDGGVWSSRKVADPMARAEAADGAEVPDGMSIPDELARRADRLARIAEAKAAIEARAKERFAREKAAHDAKLAERDAKAARTGRTPGGRAPTPPVEGPLPGDQINLTDAEEDGMIVGAQRFQTLVLPVTLTMDSTSMNSEGADLQLEPGMAVTVKFKTETRRILSHLFSPILQVTTTAVPGR